MTHFSGGPKVNGDNEIKQLDLSVASLDRVWAFLRSQDKGEFWDFAATDAQSYRPPKTQRRAEDMYSQLSSAIHALDHKPGPRKSLIVGLPRATRRLSSDELQKAIRRLRDKLLAEPQAREFLCVNFCRWVQVSRTQLLRACLSALRCAHDEVGNLRGAIPQHTPPSAQDAILPLTRQASPYDLALVCAALALNNLEWTPVWACVSHLLAKEDQKILDVPLLPRTESEARKPQFRSGQPAEKHAEPPASPSQGTVEPGHIRVESALNSPSLLVSQLDLPDLDALEVKLRALGSRLQATASEMQQGRFLDLEQFEHQWKAVAREFRSACAHLGCDATEVAKLKEVRDLRSSLLTTRTLLERLLTLRHKTDPGYSAHRRVLEDAKRGLDFLAGHAAADLQALLPGLEAVDALVVAGGELQEDEAALHDDIVRQAYGGLLAVTLQRGKLEYGAIGPADPPAAAPSAEAHVSPQDEQAAAPAAEAAAPPIADLAEQEAAYEPSVQEYAEVEEQQEADSLREAGVAPAGLNDSAHVELPQILPVEAEVASSVPAASGRWPATGDLAPKPDHVAEEQPLAERGASKAAPSELPFTTTFQNFRSSVWVGTTGQVEVAPWTSPSFASEMVRLGLAAWNEGSIGKAYLFARRFESDVNLNVKDFEQADALLERPLDLATLKDDDRPVRLRAALEDTAPLSATLALALTLESVAPTLPSNWSVEDVQLLWSRAGLKTPALQTVLVFMMTGWSSAGDPLTAIRNLIKDAPADPARLARDLQSAQSELQQVVATLWNAAGGRIMRVHCKKAWTSFVRDHVAPLRDGLAPLKARKPVDFSAQRAEMQVSSLGRAFQTIMTDGGVKHADFTAAQAAAFQIVGAIQKVVDAKRQVEALQKKPHTSTVLPRAEIDILLSDLPSNTLDRLCTLMLRAAWTQQRTTNPARLPTGLLATCPDLLRTLAADRVADLAVQEGIPIADITDEAAACAVLSAPPAYAASGATLDRNSLLERLRSFAIERERTDLLAALVPSGCLEPHEVNQLLRHALELGDQAFESTRALEAVWADCDVLLAPQARVLRAVVDEAYRACDLAASGAPIGHTLLLQAWLDHALSHAREIRTRVLGVRESEAERSPRNIAEKFRQAVAVNDVRGAMELMHPEEPASEPEERPVRRTMWRSEALRKFANPRESLVAELKSSEKSHGPLGSLSSLVSWWLSPGDNDQNYRDTLRRSLYNLISGEAGIAQEVNKRRFGGKLAELRQHKERKSVINCRVLREWFQSTRLNPTFLPQLADFDEIALTTLPITANAGNALDVYVRAAAETRRVLSVFLEPNIAPARRNEIAAGLRKRQVPAVILDDIDICRLCSVAAKVHTQDFVPFLEVVFEQLDLDLISPFSTLDGQHVRLESYVGRLQDAQNVAHGWDYSRLFSGRKLGKSAFLRFVASRYEGDKSGSRNLHVLFISIAGGSSPEWVVDTIIGEMNKRFGLWFEAESNALNNAVDRFSAYMARFAKDARKANVLIILDEADAFVEEQLRRYEKERDSSLSFKMMKQMPESDEPGVPRVRFLFAGYRVTNTRGGVWANAGDVLILKPLSEAEASEFLRGMLGRIGVDIGTHARFAARRCGYQPAVLIRFGDALLRRIRRSSRSPLREHYQVTHEDIQAVMLDPAVTEEIRTVVNNNFQGNRVAAAVFAATLLTLKDLEPGIALEDGAKHVLAKLREIEDDTQWLASRGSDPVAQVERQLQEFVDRELLTVSEGSRFGVREYRLKFPNFGAVVAQNQDLALEIKQHVQYLTGDGAPSGIVESVLPDSSLAAIRFIFRDCSAEECAVVLAAGHWSEALMDDKAGIADRLGYSVKAVVDASTVANPQEKIPTYRIFRRATAQMLPALLGARIDKPLLLLGGVDLLRAGLERLFEGGDMTMDVLPFVTMSRAAVAWWVHDIRAHNLQRAEYVDQIFRLTAGIPLLVGEFVRHLPQASLDVGDAEMARACRAFDENFEAAARQLVDGPVSVKLTLRELELLRMVGKVAGELQQDIDLQSELPDAWEMCAVSGPTPPFHSEEDRIALQLLLCLGLLPAAKDTEVSAAGKLGRISLQPDSPPFRLVKALGSIGAP